MSAVQERFAAAKRRMQEAQEEARNIARDVFKEGASAVFAAHSKLESFGWTQYTPYFNDGEECVFDANTGDPQINGDDADDVKALQEFLYVEDGTEEKEGYGGRKFTQRKYRKDPNPAFDPELASARDGVAEFLKQFENDDYREMFGDHMRVTVRRDGTIGVEEYEHE